MPKRLLELRQPTSSFHLIPELACAETHLFGSRRPGHAGVLLYQLYVVHSVRAGRTHEHRLSAARATPSRLGILGRMLCRGSCKNKSSPTRISRVPPPGSLILLAARSMASAMRHIRSTGLALIPISMSSSWPAWQRGYWMAPDLIQISALGDELFPDNQQKFCQGGALLISVARPLLRVHTPSL